jgi:hypothetical protein
VEFLFLFVLPLLALFVGGVIIFTEARRRPLLLPPAWAVSWGTLAYLPITTMGVGAVWGIPDIFARRRVLALGLGIAAAAFGACAGWLALHCRAWWQRATVGAGTGALVGFNSMYWDLGQPDTFSNGLQGAVFYAVLGLAFGVAAVRPGKEMVQEPKPE